MSESMTDQMRFDNITLIEVPVRLGKCDYLLVEANGTAVCNYKDALMAHSEIDPVTQKAKVRMNPAADATLVAGCLYKLPERSPVTLEFVQTLPGRVIEALSKRAKHISELDKEEKKDKKDADKDSLGNGEQGEQQTPPVPTPQPSDEQPSTTDG